MIVWSPAQFRALVSGERRGWWASALRSSLRVAEIPYAWAVGYRNRRFDRRPNLVHQVAVPVVSIGNLTLGGTGKTPLVAWLARWLGEQGLRVALVSRGYGAARGEQNDEARELAQQLPGVPHVQDPDRVAASREAINEYGAQLVLLDDGFQHRRLARDLDIVLIDALEPFGYDHVFPRGTLREPANGLMRAGIVALSRADMLSAPERTKLRSRVAQLTPAATWCELAHEPRQLLDAQGNQADVSLLAGRKVAALCGIGNPAGFRHTLQVCGYDVAEFREFPDHHDYSQGDLDDLDRWAKQLPVEATICTHKDLVKLGRTQLGNRPLWALSIGIRFLSGEEELKDRLQSVLARIGPPARGNCARSDL